MSTDPKPADASTGFIGTLENTAANVVQTVEHGAQSVADAVSGAAHKVNAVQLWTTIGAQLAPVFEQTLGPVVLAAEKSALSLVSQQALAGYEAAFGSLAASGLKALLARIAIPAAVAAVTAP